MSRQNWYQWLASGLLGSRNGRRRQATRRLGRAMETLENRALLSAAPVVTTLTADSISAEGAKLVGTVNPEGSTATARFQYSTHSTFQPTVQKSIGSGFNSPDGVAVDKTGDVFVADTGSNTVKEVLPNGSIRTIGSGFLAPEGVAVDKAGDVFVADTFHDAVKEVLPNGSILTIGSGFNSYPQRVAVDAAGDVLVADTVDNAVKEILPNGSIKTIGSGFNQPQDAAVDAAGDVFVADSGNQAVKEVLPNGSILTIGSGFSRPYGVAVDASGDVFIIDLGKHPIVEISPPTIGATPSPLTGTTAREVSGTLTGLAPDTTYYFRLVASSPGGTVVGTSVEFATPAKLAIGGPAVTYHTGGSAIAVAPAATLSNGDAGFANASLSVANTNPGANDRLGIQAAGSLNLSGSALIYDGTAIGTFTGGAGTASFIVTFNAKATHAAVLAVVNNITFTNTIANPSNVSTRLVNFQLTEGGGNKSAVATQTVVFSTAAANDAVFAELA